jgi:hypothetical protein
MPMSLLTEVRLNRASSKGIVALTALPKPTRRSVAAALLSSLFLALALGTPLLARGQFLPTGEGVVTPNGGPPFVSSPIFVDASRYLPASPLDICAQINEAIAAAFSGSTPTVATIDARAFTGTQPCNSNPFTNAGHSSNVGNNSIVLLLGNVTIVTSTPWWTPQQSHSIVGTAAGDVTGALGTTLAACGPTLVVPNLTYTSGTPGTCTITVSGTMVNVTQFPYGTKAKPLTFNAPHGPFPPSSALTSPAEYACLICGGGQGFVSSAGGEGEGWNHDADGEQISNIKLDLGGNDYVFGYYTVNMSERSVYSNMRWTDYGTVAGVGLMWDRTEYPRGVGAVKLSGTTRPVGRDLSLTGAGTPCVVTSPGGAPIPVFGDPGCYGLMELGGKVTIGFGSSSATLPACTTYPTAWVTAIDGSGNFTTVIGNKGSGCNTLGPTLSCTAYAAPASYPNLPATSACSATVLSGQLNSLSITPNTSFPQPTLTGGMILENVNLFEAPGVGIQEGVWAEGITNPLIGHLHCQGMNGYCEHYGAGQPVTGGMFVTHDTLDVAAGLIDLGPGVDTNQTLVSLDSAATNLVLDETNGVTLTSGAYAGHIAQYSPGLHLANAGQGATTGPISANYSQTLMAAVPGGAATAHMYDFEVTVQQAASAGSSCSSTSGVMITLTFTDTVGTSFATDTVQVPVVVDTAFGTVVPPISSQVPWASSVTSGNPPIASGHFLFTARAGYPVAFNATYSKSGCTLTPTYTLAAALRNVW